MTSDKPVAITVSALAAGQRLDVFLAEELPRYSRVQIRRAINARAVLVDDRREKASHRLRGGERILMTLPEPVSEGPEPENIPLDILYDDDQIAVVNKPPAMVVHPAKGHWSGTLTSALAYYFSELSNAGGPTRPGIVHRLDRDTSGVIVVAKTNEAHMSLSGQFEQRTTEKVYFAIICGTPDRDRNIIDVPIGDHPYSREKKAVRRDHSSSREARSFYEVLEKFDGFAAVAVTPKTGRTHQIRLHMAHIGLPVLCDPLYSGRRRITRGEIRRHREDDDVLLDRHALHAQRLSIDHPKTGARMTFEAPLPEDILGVLAELRAYR